MTEHLSLVLKQCISTKSAALAKAVHSISLKLGNLTRLHVGACIINAYSKCGIVDAACHLFDEIATSSAKQHFVLDVVFWNSIISGCVRNGRDEMAFQYFKSMQFYYSYYRNNNYADLDLDPDCYTISSLLSSSYCLERNPSLGEQLHGYSTKTAILSSLSVGNALITFYARWCWFHKAKLVFDSMPRVNVVSWTALISGYAQQPGNEEESLKIFVTMMRHNSQLPNEFTFATIFSSCGRLTSFSQGILFIAAALKLGLLPDINVKNSLVGFYSECGCLEEAEAAFKDIANPDLVSWNSLLKGYSQQGKGEEALGLFKKMLEEGETPDAITFLSLLSACRHSGMVYQGLNLFRCMKQDYGIEPEEEHISCIVDLLGRAGKLREVEVFIRDTQFNLGPSVWRTILGACRVHGQVEQAELAASRLLQLEPCDREAHFVLCNIYAASGRWDMVASLRRSVKEKGMEKEPGFSWIEVGNQIHFFLVAHWSHPQIDEIQRTLFELTNNIKEWTLETSEINDFLN
ncbi:PREDICTED: pentatricopeptide repeat-containing protein At3g24000, mitochondrial-like [Nelumbo nucifera]|uniref:Pentatricopeptide repeat-containing protein At3g24000, mitochondrial-like n=2 Tax=Nelumbo nucifera TaxID=4432 RepID=A0A1U8AQW3_NELNU|nr:PREDICTED: pentatricopeptide repeat-containing protein At3g24000, mitochondrial-like [Nelumbo nucifera]XP_010270258.1 PREDICTED: pentatricopeptide repeat-containing protein At3g24000, mitochondrial-like [Nelumbo nucifera]XP_010270261.1 PREDICTED: pentatricopeptide repeat-containing protein At3g24000, mitochondrial-like [Nelumbo nucifera]XP_010270262.1 PREDICTED: pentatricopeptide repeat-containing protein At3g24000, mitochondrial-like [Nelumbo nucifera]XP_010270263.1 PREDICTED: pentatricopep